MRHQDARRAEAALQRVGVAERLLQRVSRSRPAARPSTVASSRPFACTANIRQERIGDAVDEDGAGAAHAVLAADVRAGEAELVADEVDEQQARFDLAACSAGR